MRLTTIPICYNLHYEKLKYFVKRYDVVYFHSKHSSG